MSLDGALFWLELRLDTMKKTVAVPLLLCLVASMPVSAGDVANLDGRYSTEFLQETTSNGVQRTPLHCGTWETGVKFHAIHFDQVSFRDFRAKQPKTPERLHVFARLDDHFGGPFSDGGEAMWSLRVLDFDNEAIGWAYLDKHSELGQLLYEKLKNSSFHKLVAEFSYPPNSTSADYFVLDDVLVIDSWLTIN